MALHDTHGHMALTELRALDWNDSKTLWSIPATPESGAVPTRRDVPISLAGVEHSIE